MTQSINAFSPSQEKGSLTLLPQLNTLSGMVDSAETGTITPGCAVVMTDDSSDVMKFELASALTDDIFGFVPFEGKQSEYVANEAIKVAFNDCAMYMEASAAINSGVAVQFDPSTLKVATKTGSNTAVGYALDAASADGDKIRVLIKTPRMVDEDLVGLTASVAELNYLDLTTGPGTQEASKAVVADANVNTGVAKITALHIGVSGSETQVTATAAELNKSDISAETETVIAAGAASVTKSYTKLEVVSGGAVTLAAPDATMIGHTKVIEMTVDDGNVTMALTNVQGGTAATTCTWSNAGECLVLVAGATKWNVVSEGGVVLS
jgi:hypothetical protein